MTAISWRLSLLRRAADEQRHDVDDVLGWERGTYRQFEDAKAIPHATDIEELAVHFGVTLEYLVIGTGYQKLST